MKKKPSQKDNEQIDIAQDFMEWRDLFIDILKKEFARQKSRNSKFSMRQWAVKIGMSSGAISELLSGRRKVTQDKALEIIEAAKVPSADKKLLLAHMDIPPEMVWTAPTKEGVSLIRDWVNHAICGFYELNAVAVDAQLISERLGVPKEEIERRTRTLLQKGLLQKNGKGEIFRTKENWDASLVDSPKEKHAAKVGYIEFAKFALQNLDSENCLFISWTFTGHARQIEFIQQEIKKIMNSVDALAESETRDELIRFSVQLFPFRFKAKADSSGN